MERKQFIGILPSLLAVPNLFFQSDQDKIIKKLPESKLYIKQINESRLKYNHIFWIPLEALAYHIYLESKFDRNAFSSRLAIGIAQFKRGTAEDVGIKVYSKSKYLGLYNLEKIIERNHNKLDVLENGNNKSNFNGFLELFYNNNFKEAQRLKREWDILNGKNDKLIYNFKKQFFGYAKDKNFDERTDEKISIDKCCFLIANLCNESRKRFGGKDEHNLIRGFACYNFGIKALDYDGLPTAEETVKHVRKIIAFCDKIYTT
jgi:hypothetical protein